MNRPKVLLVGDSISMGYRDGVIERLADRAEVVRIEENGGTSRNCKEKIAAWVEQFTPGMIHLNCGLHDIALDADHTTNRVPIAEYEANLKDIVAWLKSSTRAALIWARTTPVIYERHHEVKGFDRDDEDVQAYNRVADAIMQAAGIPVNDLYAVIRQTGTEDCLGPDGVHMTDAGNAALADAVACAIGRAMAGDG